jgi:hypothetical protein
LFRRDERLIDLDRFGPCRKLNKSVLYARDLDDERTALWRVEQPLQVRRDVRDGAIND